MKVTEDQQQQKGRKRRRRWGAITTTTTSTKPQALLDNNIGCRRRRGAAATSDTGNLPCLVDDPHWTFSENNYPPRQTAHEIALQRSLPSLLYQRQCGVVTLSSAPHWQRQVLAVPLIQKEEDNDNNRIPNTRLQWRPYCMRQVEFMDLGTPLTELVLALDYSGSYILSVSDVPPMLEENDKKDSSLLLPTAFFRIRGIASPARLLRSTLRNNEVAAADGDPTVPSSSSPHVLTIPIDFAPTEQVQGRFHSKALFFSLAQDWSMGILLSPANNRPGHSAAHLTVFPLPRLLSYSGSANDDDNHDDVISIYKTSQTVSHVNVIGSLAGYNLLWQVDLVPQRPTEQEQVGDGVDGRPCWCGFVRPQSGDTHLCALNVGTELRLTWFTTADPTTIATHETDCPELRMAKSFPPSTSTSSTTKKKNVWYSLQGSLYMDRRSQFWQSAQSHRMNGAIVPPETESATVAATSSRRLSIAGEAVLRLDGLVQDILQRRPKFYAKRYNDSTTQHNGQVWTAELIDVLGSRWLNILIRFSRGNSRFPVTVIVTVDLITQLYKEVKWMRSLIDYGSIDMREVCCNFRMQYLKVGPFAPDDTAGDDSDTTEPESIDDSVGLHYTNRNRESCFMPLSVLYSDTQVISNSNILASVPKMRMKSVSPLELVYFA